LAIVAIITFLVTGPLLFQEISSTIQPAKYRLFTGVYFSVVLLIIVLFGSIFIGFKGGQVYKDEVEDGTFLIVLSKPQSRSKIILFK
jgi:ABC-type transport system involved in multi-copper enzyme maturation permease subunit